MSGGGRKIEEHAARRTRGSGIHTPHTGRRHKRLLPLWGKPVKMTPYFSVGNCLTVQGDEMKLTVLVPALAGLLWAGSALAASQLEITNPYVIQLLDGEPVNPQLLDKATVFSLEPGRHQVVVAFEGNYSSRSETKLVTAEPLVINFTAADNQQLFLDFKKPRKEEEAKRFVKEQNVVLKDKSTGQILKSEQFVMPTVGGFQLTRDYQQELINMGKAFNQPKTVAISSAAVMAAASAPAEVAPSKAMSNPEALTQLQSWYNKADAETRKAFQIWVIQQQ